MATTTNYNWTTPDDTALVKDGAAAIRSLGSSIDTTTKNLNPSTTLGDIEYRSSTANTNTRLPLGTANQLLRVNSGATAPEWATISTGGMTLISTTSLSGASVTLSSIPQTYRHLQLVVRNFRPNTTTRNLAVRVNSDSTSNRHMSFQSLTTTGYNFDDVWWNVLTQTGSTTNNGNIIINIYDYANTVTWKAATIFAWQSNDATPTAINYGITQAAYNQLSAITSLQLFANTGTINAGEALLYGVS